MLVYIFSYLFNNNYFVYLFEFSHLLIILNYRVIFIPLLDDSSSKAYFLLQSFLLTRELILTSVSLTSAFYHNML